MNNKYTGNFTKDEVPSAITQGETLNEAKKNLKEAIQRMFKDASTPYEVNIDKLVVTKLVAEDNKIRATFDFVLQAR